LVQAAKRASQALHEKRHPETKRGGDRKSAKSKRQNVDSKGYAADTANKIGKTRKTIERAVRRRKKIPDVASLAGTSRDKGAELDALAQMEPEQQAKLIEKASAGEKVSARELKKDRKQPGHKTERHTPAPVVPEQTAEDCKAFYHAEEEPDIPIFPDACTAIGAPALPLSVSAPSVARLFRLAPQRLFLASPASLPLGSRAIRLSTSHAKRRGE
jgi:hypothetical protein